MPMLATLTEEQVITNGLSDNARKKLYQLIASWKQKYNFSLDYEKGEIA